MTEYEFSVIVITYNPIWEKVKLTLDGILRQKFEDYEIVVADDGSKEDVFDKIEQYFSENNFTRYTFVKNEVNQGTVKNLLSGLSASKGRFIRMSGPGDLFYDENSLGKVHEFMVKSECEGCFGLMKGYYINEHGDINIRPYTFPFDLRCYRSNDDYKVMKNLVLYGDNVSGAAMCLERNYMKEYLERITGNVKYLEDVFQVMAVLDGRRLQLFDDYLIWYEDNVGVSTSKNTGFRELLRKDNDSFYEMIFSEYSDNKLVQKRKGLKGIYKINNPYIRMIVSAFKNPGVIGWLFNHYIDVFRHSYDSNNSEKGFMDLHGKGGI